MKTWSSLLVVLALAACADNSADVVYTNGRIYTVNEAQPWAEAVAIKDGKFLVVGSNEDVAAVTGEDTEVVDLEGAFAMPGIQDAHLHPSTGGANIDAAVGGFVFTEDMRLAWTRTSCSPSATCSSEWQPRRQTWL